MQPSSAKSIYSGKLVGEPISNLFMMMMIMMMMMMMMKMMMVMMT